MLIFTNRIVLSGHGDESAFTTKFVPASDTLGIAEVTRTGPAHGSLARVTPAVSDAAAEAALVRVLEGDRPVLVHVHGNSMAPPSASSAAPASRSSSMSRWSASRGPRKAGCPRASAGMA